MGKYRPEKISYRTDLSREFGIKMSALITFLDYWCHEFASETDDLTVPYFCDGDELANIIGLSNDEWLDLVEEIDQTGYIKYWQTTVSTMYGEYKESNKKGKYAKETTAWAIDYDKLNRKIERIKRGK